jgi:hypothetical protein
VLSRARRSAICSSIAHDYRTYAVALKRSNATLPAAAWYFPFHLLFFFSLWGEKKNNKKEDQVPL